MSSDRPGLSDQEQALIQLAKEAIIAEVMHRSLPNPAKHSMVHPVFITIERNGKILGCQGDLTPRTGSLEDEVIFESRAAAAHDPRYHALNSKDLNGFLVTVTIVSRTEPIDSVDSLRPADGLVLESGNQTGIVLPWEGKNPQIRLKWAYEKAHVPIGSPATLLRLIAKRFRG